MDKTGGLPHIVDQSLEALPRPGLRLPESERQLVEGVEAPSKDLSDIDLKHLIEAAKSVGDLEQIWRVAVLQTYRVWVRPWPKGTGDDLVRAFRGLYPPLNDPIWTAAVVLPEVAKEWDDFTAKVEFDCGFFATPLPLRPSIEFLIEHAADAVTWANGPDGYLRHSDHW